MSRLSNVYHSWPCLLFKVLSFPQLWYGTSWPEASDINIQRFSLFLEEESVCENCLSWQVIHPLLLSVLSVRLSSCSMWVLGSVSFRKRPPPLSLLCSPGRQAGQLQPIMWLHTYVVAVYVWCNCFTTNRALTVYVCVCVTSHLAQVLLFIITKLED